MAENFFLLGRGPGKLELMLALFDRMPHDELRPRTVMFTTAPTHGIPTPGDFEVVVTGVSMVDKYGAAWNFEGRLAPPRHDKESLVRGYWETDRRMGYLWMVESHIFVCEEPEKGA